MNFILITDVNDETIVLNINNIVSLNVVHPREDNTMTVVETSAHGCRYYVRGNIIKDFIKIISSKNGSVSQVNIRNEV